MGKWDFYTSRELHPGGWLENQLISKVLTVYYGVILYFTFGW